MCKIVSEIARGRLVLVEVKPPRVRATSISDPLDLVDLTELLPAEPLQAEDEDEQTAFNVMLCIHYDPDQPAGGDDTLRLFTSRDDGDTCDVTVSLASEADTQRANRHLLVLFKDVAPDHAYSCFLDLGRDEGGYLLFFRHMLSRVHHVDGLPRDT